MTEFRILKFYKAPIFWLGVFAFFSYIYSMNSLTQENQIQRHLIPPPNGIEHITFGMKEQTADGLWIRAIQDFDYCEQKLDQVNCQNNGWVWQMLDTVTNLAPQFRIVYATGTLALSVIVSDIQGASKLFDKAVKAFPKDWPILYRAAYHALYEENNKEKAAELLIRTAQNGGPDWTYSLAGKLYTQAGKLELTEKLIQDLISQEAPEALIEHMKKRLAKAKSESN